MSLQVGDLFAKVRLDWSSLPSDLSNISGQFGDAVDGITQKFGDARAAVGALGLATAGVMASTIAPIENYGKTVERLSVVTGMTTGQTSQLIAGFGGAGIGADQAASMMQRLEFRLGALEAAHQKARAAGKDQADMLQQIGVNTQDATGHMLPMNQLLPQIIDKMGQMTDIGEKNRLATQLFGRSWTELAPLMAAGGQAFTDAMGNASKFGLMMSQQQADQIHQLQVAKTQLGEAFLGLQMSIGGSLIPVLTNFITHISDIVASFQKLSPGTKSTIDEVLKLVAVFGSLVGGAAAINGAMGLLATHLPGIGGLIQDVGSKFTFLLGPLGLVIGAFVGFKEAYDHVQSFHQALQPLVDVFGNLHLSVGNFLDKLKELAAWMLSNGLNALITFGNWFANNVLAPFVQWIVTDFIPALENMEQWFKSHIYPALQAVGEWFSTTGLDALRGFGNWLRDDLFKTLGDLVGWFIDHIWPALSQFGEWFIKTGIPAIGQFAEWLYSKVISNLYEFAKALVQIVGALVTGLAPILLTIAQVVGPAVAGVFKLIGDNMWAVDAVLAIVIGRFIILKGIDLYNWAMQSISGIVQLIAKLGDLSLASTLRGLTGQGSFFETAAKGAAGTAAGDVAASTVQSVASESAGETIARGAIGTAAGDIVADETMKTAGAKIVEEQADVAHRTLGVWASSFFSPFGNYLKEMGSTMKEVGGWFMELFRGMGSEFNNIFVQPISRGWDNLKAKVVSSTDEMEADQHALMAMESADLEASMAEQEAAQETKLGWFANMKNKFISATDNMSVADHDAMVKREADSAATAKAQERHLAEVSAANTEEAAAMKAENMSLQSTKIASDDAVTANALAGDAEQAAGYSAMEAEEVAAATAAAPAKAAANAAGGGFMGGALPLGGAGGVLGAVAGGAILGTVVSGAMGNGPLAGAMGNIKADMSNEQNAYANIEYGPDGQPVSQNQANANGAQVYQSQLQQFRANGGVGGALSSVNTTGGIFGAGGFSSDQQKVLQNAVSNGGDDLAMQIQKLTKSGDLQGALELAQRFANTGNDVKATWAQAADSTNADVRQMAAEYSNNQTVIQRNADDTMNKQIADAYQAAAQAKDAYAQQTDDAHSMYNTLLDAYKGDAKAAMAAMESTNPDYAAREKKIEAISAATGLSAQQVLNLNAIGQTTYKGINIQIDAAGQKTAGWNAMMDTLSKEGLSSVAGKLDDIHKKGGPVATDLDNMSQTDMSGLIKFMQTTGANMPTQQAIDMYDAIHGIANQDNTNAKNFFSGILGAIQPLLGPLENAANNMLSMVGLHINFPVIGGPKPAGPPPPKAGEGMIVDGPLNIQVGERYEREWVIPQHKARGMDALLDSMVTGIGAPAMGTIGSFNNSSHSSSSNISNVVHVHGSRLNGSDISNEIAWLMKTKTR